MTHPGHLASADAANLARLLDASPGLAAAAGQKPGTCPLLRPGDRAAKCAGPAAEDT